MRTIQSLLCLLFLVSLCFLGACRMTEEQIRSIPPELMKQELSSHKLEPETAATPKRLPPLGVMFAGLALLVGTILYLKADQKDSARPRRSRKKAKYVSGRSKTRKKS